MSIDTEIQGSPANITAAAVWVRDKLGVELGHAVDRLTEARRDAQGSWRSTAGEQFAGVMTTARGKTEDLESAANDMAKDLEDFAEDLKTCQNDMATIREEARSAELTVTGFIIQDPGPGPERPPDGFTGTETEVAAHNADVAAYDAHQDKIRAYNHASSEAARIDRKYANACRSLEEKYTVGQHASWIISVTDILGDSAAAVIGTQIKLGQNKLNGAASDLLDEAKVAIAELQAHPEKYIKRKWLFFESLDATRLEADRLAIEGKLTQAEDLLKESDALKDGRLPKILKGGGKILGPLGIVAGVYNDYQEGESTEQIVVSQGASTVLGAAATVGTSMAVGAAVGSVVPVAGTAVGAVVGAVVGTGIAIFSDGAIDSFFENGPDVGKAFEEGVDALADTGGAIKDGVSGAIGAVGGLFD